MLEETQRTDKLKILEDITLSKFDTLVFLGIHQEVEAAPYKVEKP